MPFSFIGMTTILARPALFLTEMQTTPERLTSPTKTSKTTGAFLSAGRYTYRRSTTGETRRSGTSAMTGTESLLRKVRSRSQRQRNFRVISAARSTRRVALLYLFTSPSLGSRIHRLYLRVAPYQPPLEASGPGTKFRRAVSVRYRQGY